MLNELNIADCKIEIRRSRRAKKYKIVVDCREENDLVYISAPRFMTISDISRAIDKHSKWIAKMIAAKQIEKNRILEIYSSNGGKIPLLGGWITLADNRVIDDFYRKKAKDFFYAACEKYAKSACVNFKKITIRDQKTRYGSCSSNGSLNFNYRIIKAPLFVAEYIAAHEIAHLKYMSHNADFWRFVGQIYGDYRSAENWLKHNGFFLRYDPTP